MSKGQIVKILKNKHLILMDQLIEKYLNMCIFITIYFDFNVNFQKKQFQISKSKQIFRSKEKTSYEKAY